RSFAAGAGAAGLLVASAPLDFARAQGGPLKVGVLLPLSGAQASIGQDCYRGVEVAPGIFQALGLPELAIMKADTETNVEVARARTPWSALSIPPRPQRSRRSPSRRVSLSSSTSPPLRRLPSRATSLCSAISRLRR